MKVLLCVEILLFFVIEILQVVLGFVKRIGFRSSIGWRRGTLEIFILAERTRNLAATERGLRLEPVLSEGDWWMI